VAVDIFTNKKMESLEPSSHNCDVPHVSRTEYTLIDISDDGFVSLMTDSGDTKDDLTLPKGTDELDKLAIQIKEEFDAGKELVLAVLSVSYKFFLDKNVIRCCFTGSSGWRMPIGRDDKSCTIKFIVTTADTLSALSEPMETAHTHWGA